MTTKNDKDKHPLTKKSFEHLLRKAAQLSEIVD